VNIGILIGHFPPGNFGGAELQAEGWAERLAQRHHVDVVTRRDPPQQPKHQTRDGFRVLRTPVARVPLLRTWLDIRAIESTVSSLTPRPDVLLCFQTFVSGLAGVRLQQRLGPPAVVWIRGELEYQMKASGRARWFSPRVWSEARAILVQSDTMRSQLLEELATSGRASLAASLDRKLFVVPNGIELPSVTARTGDRILAVGRLIPKKGMDVVVDAVADMQGRLTIAGDGPERQRLEARARRHGLDAQFVGRVSRERLSELYRESSCVVLAARSGEGLPNVLLEAMAHGRAVVATEVGGVSDLVRHGDNGLTVPRADPVSLREALERLANEDGLADRLGAGGRVTAEAYAWESIRPKLEDILSQTVRENSV
jgi:glycosyltransferase involved in cell wall biosynthesis